MEWPEALELVLERTKHEPFRKACADGSPNAEIWRARILTIAGQPTPDPVREYPSLVKQAGNALGAIGRAVGAVVAGEPVKVAGDVYEARTAICEACSEYDAAADRCRACGCHGVKRRLATERCPLDPPKWSSV